MKIKRFNSFLMFIGIITILLSLRLFSNYPKEISLFVESVIVVVEKIIIALGISEFIFLFQKIPFLYVIIFFDIACFLIGVIFITFFKKGIEQGAMSIVKSPFSVIKTGNILYFMIFSVVFIFIISVIGIPIALLIFLITILFLFWGNLCLSVYLGYNICQYLKSKKNIYIYFLIGSIVKVSCKVLYAFGLAFVLYIFPVFSLGIVCVTFYNKFILKMSYKIELYGKDKFDRNKIKDIIKKGL